MDGTPVCRGRRHRWLAAVAVVAVVASGCLVLPPAPGENLPADHVAPIARVVADISYGPDPAQMIDLYFPSTVGPHPVLVYLHAGGWVAGTHQIIPEFLLSEVERRSMVLAAVDYRLVVRDPEGSVTNAFPTQVGDTDRAVRYLRANASQWDLNPAQFLLAGASAGGTLAMLAAADPGRYAASDLPPELANVSPRVLGVLSFVGPSDFATFADAGGMAPALEAAFLGCPTADPASCDPGVVAAASVARHLGPGAPPAFLAYGRYDGLVRPDTQGWPLALHWTAARGELGVAPLWARGVWYDRAEAGHNLDGTTINIRVMDIWIDFVLAGILR